MSSSSMVNFRAKNHLLALIDEAAAHAGMDRSTWLRQTAEKEAVATLSGPQIRFGSDTAAKNGSSPEEEMPRASKEDCLHPKENVNFIPGINLRLCTLCGAKF